MEETIFTIVVIVAVAGLLILTMALLAGLKIIKAKPIFRFHKRWALVGFICIAIHAVVMLYFYLFS